MSQEFTKGDLILPRLDEYEHPRDTLRVDRWDGIWLIAYPMGGGFERRFSPDRVRELDFQKVDPNTELGWNPARFTIDHEKTYPGFTKGDRWNGWACPVFTRATAEHLVKDLDGSWEDDTAVITSEEYDEPERYDPMEIHLYGDTVKVWAIGAYAWIWDTAEDE